MLSRFFLRFKPPRIAMFCLMLALAVHAATGGWDAFEVVCALCLGSLLAAGFTLMITAWAQFRVRQTAICPTARASSMVTKGVFRFTRNPMYLGMVLMMLGLALGMGSYPVATAALVFFLILQRVFIPYEEQRLAEWFGIDYLAYRARVRRWI